MNESVAFRRRIKIIRNSEKLQERAASMKAAIATLDPTNDVSVNDALRHANAVVHMANDVIFDLALIRGIKEYL